MIEIRKKTPEEEIIWRNKKNLFAKQMVLESSEQERFGEKLKIFAINNHNLMIQKLKIIHANSGYLKLLKEQDRLEQLLGMNYRVDLKKLKGKRIVYRVYPSY